MRKHKEVEDFTLELLSKEAQPVTITDCHASNPCELEIDLTAKSNSLIIEGMYGQDWKEPNSLRDLPYIVSLSLVLGILVGIKVSQGKDCVEIKQERYVMKILKEAGMEDFNQTLCLMEPGLKLSKTKDESEVEAT
ncbi:hypothetical protein Tco_0716471 [Tanacetum coccineum]